GVELPDQAELTCDMVGVNPLADFAQGATQLHLLLAFDHVSGHGDRARGQNRYDRQCDDQFEQGKPRFDREWGIGSGEWVIQTAHCLSPTASYFSKLIFHLNSASNRVIFTIPYSTFPIPLIFHSTSSPHRVR